MQTSKVVKPSWQFHLVFDETELTLLLSGLNLRSAAITKGELVSSNDLLAVQEELYAEIHSLLFNRKLSI